MLNIGPMMREVSLETLPNIDIRDSSYDKNDFNWANKSYFQTDYFL